MERAFAFYTEVLGGTEVMRDGDFHGERIHNTLLTDQEIEARERQVDPRTLGIPDLRGGAQRLDVRFIQFDNVVIELLKYRNAEQTAAGAGTFAEPLDHMSPAFPRMMHICFHIRDDVDFNQFIGDLEAESARRGMTQVRANRVVTVTSEGARRAAPKEANSNGITEGRSAGWRLIYCKGCEGEQLEFVQALGPVKQTIRQRARGSPFDAALSSTEFHQQSRRARMNATLKSHDLTTVPGNPFLEGVHTPMKGELTIEHLPVQGHDPGSVSMGATCASARTRCGRIQPTITGSPATAWSTASGSRVAARSGIAIAGSAPRPSARPWASREPKGRATPSTPSTPMSSALPARRWEWWRLAARPWNSASC